MLQIVQVLILTGSEGTGFKALIAHVVKFAKLLIEARCCRH